MIVAQGWLDAPELVSLPSGYTVRCRGRGCSRAAKTIARALDSQGRPLKQIELCDAHLKALAAVRPVTTFRTNPLPQINDDALLFHALTRLWFSHQVGGEVETSLEVAKQLLSLAKSGSSRSTKARVSERPSSSYFGFTASAAHFSYPTKYRTCLF